VAFSPDLEQARQLYLAHGAELFALCYLHAGGPKGANTLLQILLCDLATSPRCWRLANTGKGGLFRCAHNACMEQYYKRPKRKKKRKKGGPEPLHTALPFVMTDSLRAIIDLPPKYKTPLYLRVALGWSVEDSAAAIGGPAARVDRLTARALKKARLTGERARQALSTVAPLPDGPEEQWNTFLIDREDKNFAGQQRLRRFKRWLDHAIPAIALGTVVFCVFAYQAVEHGWFSGQAYVPTVPSEPEKVIDYAVDTATVYGIENGGFIQYNVTNCPLSPKTVVRQMVALGGAPEGTSVLSVEQADDCLTVELSKEAAQWLRTAPEEERELMRGAMAATFSATYPGVKEVHLTSAGEELIPQDLLGIAVTPARTVTTPYHE